MRTFRLRFWRWLDRLALKRRNALEPRPWFEGIGGVETPEQLATLLRKVRSR